MSDIILGKKNPLCETFDKLHEMQPEIFELFEKFTLQVAQTKKHYSANAIIDRIRWHTEIEGHGTFKINAVIVPFYARMFIQKHPELKGFFRMRRAAADEHLGYEKSKVECDLVERFL